MAASFIGQASEGKIGVRSLIVQISCIVFIVLAVLGGFNSLVGIISLAIAVIVAGCGIYGTWPSVRDRKFVDAFILGLVIGLVLTIISILNGNGIGIVDIVLRVLVAYTALLIRIELKYKLSPPWTVFTKICGK